MEISQVHHGLQRHHGLEGHRLQVQHLQLRLHESPDFVLPQHLVQGLGNHELQRFLHQRVPPQVTLHNGAGSLAGTEAGNANPASQPTVGAVQERLLVF